MNYTLILFMYSLKNHLRHTTSQMIRKIKNTDLNRLRLFMKVKEYGGFAPVANQLGMSASNVSIQMKELENSLGVILCLRGKSGFSLTPEGEKIYEASQTLMLAHDNFESAVGRARGHLVGNLRIGVIDNMVFDPNLSIPNVITEFRKRAPEVEISLLTMSPSELEREILEQRLHIAIGVFYEHKVGLTYHHICSEKLSLYCGYSHPLYDEKKHSFDVIQKYSYIERTYGETLTSSNIPFEPAIGAYTSSLEATLMLILSGQYLGFLPTYYANHFSFKGKIKPILLDTLHINSKVSALVHSHPINRAMTNTSLEILFQHQPNPATKII